MYVCMYMYIQIYILLFLFVIVIRYFIKAYISLFHNNE